MSLNACCSLNVFSSPDAFICLEDHACVCAWMAEEELEINVLKFHENQQVIHVERREVESKLYDEFNAHKQVAKVRRRFPLPL